MSNEKSGYLNKSNFYKTGICKSVDGMEERMASLEGMPSVF
jgi:hypothetical protein